jgi:hypothetical protein
MQKEGRLNRNTSTNPNQKVASARKHVSFGKADEPHQHSAFHTLSHKNFRQKFPSMRVDNAWNTPLVFGKQAATARSVICAADQHSIQLPVCSYRSVQCLPPTPLSKTLGFFTQQTASSRPTPHNNPLEVQT